MKIIRLPFGRLAGFASLLLAGALTSSAQMPFPYGDWDCVLSERHSGLAVLHFEPGNNLFTGVQVMRPSYRAVQPSSTNPRYSGGDPTRTGQDSSSGTPNTNDLILGATALQGSWYYESPTRILGFVDQITFRYELSEVVTTNLNELTGQPVYLTNLVYTNIYSTNSISFRASGVDGQRLTLTSYLSTGKKNIYRGKPSVMVTDQSGPFYASGKRGGIPFVEFFTLSPSVSFPLPNVYSFNGNGAGYGFTGLGIVSRSGRIALYNQADRDTFRITAYVGAYNTTLRKGSMDGYDSDGRRPTYRLVHY